MTATLVQPYFFPPGFEPQTHEEMTLTFGDEAEALRLSLPVLTPAALEALSLRLLEAQEAHLARRPIADIVEVIDQAVQRWLDPHSVYRQQAEAWLPAITRYSPAMIRHGLDTLLQALRKEALWRLLQAEFGDPQVLDTFRPRPHVGSLTRAYGPRLVTHIFSGNVPALSAWSLVCALLTKSASVGKSASEEPLFAALFARSLWEVCPDLGACLAVCWWKGGETALEEAAFAHAGAVIAYGSEATIRDVQQRVPAAARFLAYGHKLSFGVVGREALTAARAPQTAHRAAYGVSMFDQQGCVSPHLLFVEAGGEVSPRAFADLLAEGMQQMQVEFPRGRLSLTESTAIRHLRGTYEFRQLADDRVLLLCSEPGTAWTVIYEEDAPFTASCLNRTIRVHAVDHIAAIPARLEPVRAYLQTAGAALPRQRLLELAEALGGLGVTRLCALERMPWPGMTWHHDGRPNLADLVRWTDIEAGTDG
jgi:hypothetical protein